MNRPFESFCRPMTQRKRLEAGVWRQLRVCASSLSWHSLIPPLLLAAGCGFPPSSRPPATEAPAPHSQGLIAAPPTAAATAPPPSLPAMEARSLARRIRANLDTPYELLTYAMELVDSRGATEQREAAFHMASSLEGNDCAYTCFTKPAEIQGFGLLTVRPPKADPDQFLYVPASKKVSRILYFATNRRSSFCGTQFTFEDLEPLAVDDFDFRSAGTEVRAGRPCYLLESTPRNRSSGYSRMVHSVDAATALVFRTVFHDTRNQLLKTLSGADPFEIAPGHWRLRQVEVTNHQAARSTRMTLLAHRVVTTSPGPAERAIFTLATLSQGREK